MFIAMNRFKIAPGYEAGFEKIWRERDSYLSEVPGFESFALLKGGLVEVVDGDDYVL
jgi:heme-degrading monooxygenase HmoA